MGIFKLLKTRGALVATGTLSGNTHGGAGGEPSLQTAGLLQQVPRVCGALWRRQLQNLCLPLHQALVCLPWVPQRKAQLISIES